MFKISYKIKYIKMVILALMISCIYGQLVEKYYNDYLCRCFYNKHRLPVFNCISNGAISYSYDLKVVWVNWIDFQIKNQVKEGFQLQNCTLNCSALKYFFNGSLYKFNIPKLFVTLGILGSYVFVREQDSLWAVKVAQASPV